MRPIGRVIDWQITTTSTWYSVCRRCPRESRELVSLNVRESQDHQMRVLLSEDDSVNLNLFAFLFFAWKSHRDIVIVQVFGKEKKFKGPRKRSRRDRGGGVGTMVWTRQQHRKRFEGMNSCGKRDDQRVVARVVAVTFIGGDIRCFLRNFEVSWDKETETETGRGGETRMRGEEKEEEELTEFNRIVEDHLYLADDSSGVSGLCVTHENHLSKLFPSWVSNLNRERSYDEARWGSSEDEQTLKTRR
jgi:hypothetical protein